MLGINISISIEISDLLSISIVSVSNSLDKESISIVSVSKKVVSKASVIDLAMPMGNPSRCLLLLTKSKVKHKETCY